MNSSKKTSLFQILLAIAFVASIIYLFNRAYSWYKQADKKQGRRMWLILIALYLFGLVVG